MTADTADWFFLATPSGEATLQGIALFRDPVIPLQDAACSEAADPKRGHAVNDFIDFLTSQSGLITSEPAPVTVGGLSGMTLDLSLAEAGTEPCLVVGIDSVTYLTQDKTPSEYLWSVGYGEFQRVSFLDDGNGGVIAVVINARGQTKFDLVTLDAIPIIDSLSFVDRP